MLHVAEKTCEEKKPPADKNNAESKVVAATGAGESRVCLGVILVKVRSKNGIDTVETYALLDSGSEVTICSEKLGRSLKARGKKTSFNLTGITGSQNIDSQLIDIVVESMGGTTIIELDGVRTVKYIPISSQCIPKRRDLEKWPHLQNVDLHVFLLVSSTSETVIPFEQGEKFLSTNVKTVNDVQSRSGIARIRRRVQSPH